MILLNAQKRCEEFGYDEINLNVGCPSDRVQKGKFGACLMLEPNLVAECLMNMRNVVDIPVLLNVDWVLIIMNHMSFYIISFL